MRYVFDLSGDRFRTFEFFPDALAALAVPHDLEEQLSLLVWGAVLPKPEHFPEFRALLPQPVRDEDDALYLSGWGTLTFNGVRGGCVTVWPYEPVFPPGDLRMMHNAEGQLPTLTRTWAGFDANISPEYVLSIVLEQPLGFMALKLQAAGPVTFSVAPSDFVTWQRLKAFPQRYGPDLTRTRQLGSHPAAVGANHASEAVPEFS
jgi:hypothetical protein